MTPEERELLIRLERRAEHVRKVAAIALKPGGTFAPTILAYVAWNLVRTLMLLCPQALLATFTSWMHGHLREEAGLCDLCGAMKDRPAERMCAACLRQMEAEEAEAMLSELGEDARPQ